MKYVLKYVNSSTRLQGLLGKVSSNSRIPALLKDLMPEYIELLNDEEDIVREAAVTSLLNLLDILDADTKITMLIPNFRKMCENPGKILNQVAKSFGLFLFHTRELINENDTRFFIGVYQEMAVSPQENLRDMCAFNFPALVSIFGKWGFTTYRLSKILEMLTADQSNDIRIRISASFHEVVKVLGNESYHHLKSIFLRLLNDKEIQVAQPVISNLTKILGVLYTDESCKKPDQHLEILNAILKRERELASDPNYPWRNHLEFIDQFQSFGSYFDPEQLHDLCIVNLTKSLNDVCHILMLE